MLREITLGVMTDLNNVSLVKKNYRINRNTIQQVYVTNHLNEKYKY